MGWNRSKVVTIGGIHFLFHDYGRKGKKLEHVHPQVIHPGHEWQYPEEEIRKAKVWRSVSKRPKGMDRHGSNMGDYHVVWYVICCTISYMTIWSILIFVCIKCTRSSYKNQYGLNGVWILVGCDVSLLYRSCLTWCSRIKDSKNQRYVAFQRDLFGISAFPVETGRFASFCSNNKTLSLDFWIILCRMLEVGGVFYQQLGSKIRPLEHLSNRIAKALARTAQLGQRQRQAFVGVKCCFLQWWVCKWFF